MRALIVRLGAFGDIVHSLPLAADLHAAHIEVDWLCEDRWASLLIGSPIIDRVWSLPRAALRTRPSLSPAAWALRRQLARQLRRRRYDLVFEAQGLNKSAFWAWAAGGRRCLAHAAPRARELSRLLPASRIAVLAEHVIDQQRALALPLLHQPRQRGGWRFPLPAWAAETAWARAWLASKDVRAPWLLNVGAGWPSKVWPLARQVEFAGLCQAQGRRLLVLWGGNEERTVAEAICQAVPASLLAPATSLPQLGALARQAAVMISGDTGPLHLAMACGCPAVGLFGPVPGRRNGPRGPHGCFLQAPGQAWERRDASKGGMQLIEAAAVFAAATARARP